MTTTSVLLAVGQALLLVGALAAVHVPLGAYLARTFTSDGHTRVERGIYRLLRVDPDAEMRWTAYLRGVLALSLVSIVAVMLLARSQDRLPLAAAWQPRRRPCGTRTTCGSTSRTCGASSRRIRRAATPADEPGDGLPL